MSSQYFTPGLSRLLQTPRRAFAECRSRENRHRRFLSRSVTARGAAQQAKVQSILRCLRTQGLPHGPPQVVGTCPRSKIVCGVITHCSCSECFPAVRPGEPCHLNDTSSLDVLHSPTQKYQCQRSYSFGDDFSKPAIIALILRASSRLETFA